ncbi:polypeptide deformylase [Legionella beliardensis]|uniref:Peptide deformylase n=1 Tax=Legionella beliardensis TaxID=91822 RepID=A0A378I5P0_9GAMM|nr:peptide deformylase [Legionella beliardensis]STX30035.1 polypeptide deformylase [Legionella beliardensis]
MSQLAFPLNIITVEQEANKKILTSQAQDVQFPLAQEDLELVKAMKERLLALEGVGLAAPQVNQAKRIIAIYIPENAALLRKEVRPYPLHILFNPHYEPINEHEKIADFEACYSVSSKAGKVPRYKQIKLTYFDESGAQHQTIEEGFYARVLQHEIDHLNGTLIIDRLTADCVQGTLAEMMELRRSELSEEQKKLFDELMQKKALKKDS